MRNNNKCTKNTFVSSLSCRASGEPITTNYIRIPANNKAQNTTKFEKKKKKINVRRRNGEAEGHAHGLRVHRIFLVQSYSDLHHLLFAVIGCNRVLQKSKLKDFILFFESWAPSNRCIKLN